MGGYCKFMQDDNICPAICRPPPHTGTGDDCMNWRLEDPLCSAYIGDCNEMCSDERRSGPKRGMQRNGPRGQECPEQCQTSTTDDIDQCLTELKEDEECSKYKSCHMDCLSDDECPSSCQMPEDDHKSCMEYIDSSDECYMYSSCYEVCKGIEGIKPNRGRPRGMGGRGGSMWGNRQQNNGDTTTRGNNGQSNNNMMMNQMMNMFRQMMQGLRLGG